MNLSITLHTTKVTDRVKEYAERLRASLLAAHQSTPFADLDAVSEHLMRDRNPRLKVSTNENGTKTEVSYNNERLLTIHG